jgi:hypothetical protein
MPTKHKRAAVKATPAPVPEDKMKAITPEEQAIAARVSAEAMDWQTISEDDALDYSLGRDRMPNSLPSDGS